MNDRVMKRLFGKIVERDGEVPSRSPEPGEVWETYRAIVLVLSCDDRTTNTLVLHDEEETWTSGETIPMEPFELDEGYSTDAWPIRRIT